MLPPRRHYCMMLLLVLLAFDAPSSHYLAKRLTHLLIKPTEYSLESSSRSKNQACLVSQCFKPVHSVQAKNVFLPYGSTRVTCRNTLMIGVSFHRLAFTVNPIAFLCVFNLWRNMQKWKKPLECEFWYTLSAYFTILMNSKTFKNGIIGLYITQAILHNKLRINFSMSPSL